MASWLDLAKDSRKAASTLVRENRHHSAISRAYYAAYSKVTHELIHYGVTMPSDWEGPPHAKIRTLIEKRFVHMDKQKREALSRMVGSLYAMRLAADYSPSAIIDPRESREAAAIMKKVFDAF